MGRRIVMAVSSFSVGWRPWVATKTWIARGRQALSARGRIRHRRAIRDGLVDAAAAEMAVRIQ